MKGLVAMKKNMTRRGTWLFVLAVAMLIGVIPLRADCLDGAAWIGESAAAGLPRFLRFRCPFDGTGEPLRIRLSADQRYVLLLDGRIVGRGPALGDLNGWHSQAYAFTPEKGRHLLEAVVWSLGVGDRPSAQLASRTSFVLKADGPYDGQLTTGRARWEVGTLVGTAPAGLGAKGEAFGAGCQFVVTGTSVLDEKPVRFVPASIIRPSAPDYSFVGVRAEGWHVVPSILPEQLHRTIRPGDIPRPFAVTAHKRVELVFDLGNYYCGYPQMSVSGGRGAKITWGWTEALRDPSVRDAYSWADPAAKATCSKGDRARKEGMSFVDDYALVDRFLCDGRACARFTTPWWRCGRWCRIVVETDDEPIEVTDISIDETRYPVEKESFFETDDPSLSPIESMCVRGVQMCAHELMYDCPFWEQQMYPGDCRVSFLALTAVSSDDRLIRQSLGLFDAARRPDGSIPMNWPSGHDQHSVTWTLAWVISLGDYALWHADRNWLASRLPGLEHTMLALGRFENERGLLDNVPGWSYVDWVAEWRKNQFAPPGAGKELGESAVLNLLYLSGMRAAVQALEACGEFERAACWRQKGARLGRTIRERFWNEPSGRMADTPKANSYSEHAQALAITTDILSKEEAARALSALVRGEGLAKASSFGLNCVFEAFAKAGRGDLVLERLGCWRSYVAQRMNCPLESEVFPRSDCHGFGAHPLFHFHAAVAGVTPAAPFFGKVRVAPAPGPLRRLHARTPHPKGFVETDLVFDGRGGVFGDVRMPAGIAGEFVWQGSRLALTNASTRIRMGSCGKRSDALAEGFQSPPKESRPETWFHLIGRNVSREGLTRDLETIARAGIGGVQLFVGGKEQTPLWPGVRPGPDLLTPEWEELIVHAARECRRLGLTFKMQNCPGWSMAGGPWITPDTAMRDLVVTKCILEPGVPFAWPDPPRYPSNEIWRDYRDIAVVSFEAPEGDEMVPLARLPMAKALASGRIVWTNETAAVIRSIDLPTPNSLCAWRYGPNAFTVELAVDGAHVGSWTAPHAGWQDDSPWTLSVGECRGREFALTFRSASGIDQNGEVVFSMQAKVGNYAALASRGARTLRGGDDREVDARHFVRTLGVTSPKKRRTVLRFGSVVNGRRNGPCPAAATGLECDKLDARGADAHYAGYVGRLVRGPLKGLLDGFVLDSWECGTPTWSLGLERRFKERFGYDAVPFLPALEGYVVSNNSATASFLRDWREHLSRSVADGLFGRMAQHARADGLSIGYEMASGHAVPGDPLAYFRHADVPMFEFWANGDNLHDDPDIGRRRHDWTAALGFVEANPVRPAVSAANVYGKRLVAAESLTTGRADWRETPVTMRPYLDWAFAHGLNHVVLHTYTHHPSDATPPPGVSLINGFGSAFVREQTWWPAMMAFTDRIARQSYLLSRGMPVKDALLLLGDEYDFRPPHFLPFPQGYDYDYVNSDALARLTARDGAMETPEGIRYRFLWIRPSTELKPETAAKVAALEAAGIRIVRAADPSAAIRASGLEPDVVAEPSVRFVHRHLPDGDVYFLYNDSVRTAEAWLARFRNRRAVCERWNPSSGEIFRLDSDRLQLLPHASEMVVFRNRATAGERPDVGVASTVLKTLAPGSRWRLTLSNPALGTHRIDLSKLSAWCDLPDPKLQGFSGRGEYTCRFSLTSDEAKRATFVVFERIEGVAEVKLNGKSLGWNFDGRTAFAGTCRSGENELAVTVYSSWRNALVADGRLAAGERRLWTDGVQIRADDPYLPYGLCGKVTLSDSAPAAATPPLLASKSFYEVGARSHTGIPSIAVSPKNGRLWLTCYCAWKGAECAYNYCPLMTSKDGGRTWKQVMVADPDGEGPLRNFDPELFVNRAGKLIWSWTERTCDPKDPFNGCFADPKEDRLMLVELDAENEPVAPYPEPRLACRGVMMCKPIDLADGRTLLPVSHWFDDPSACFYSTTDWKTFAFVGGAKLPKGARQFDEHAVVQRSDGSLLTWIRTTGEPRESVSNDGGKTWSEPVQSQVGNPNSRLFCTKLKNGHLLMVKHGKMGEHFQKKGWLPRRELRAFVSTDDGKTWQGDLVVDARTQGLSYPDGDVAADGSVYIVYDYDRTGAQELLVARVTEADVLAGKLVSPGSFLRRIASCEACDSDEGERR